MVIMSKIGIKRHSLTGTDVIRANLTCLIAVALFAFTFTASDILLNDWGSLSVFVFRNICAYVL